MSKLLSVINQNAVNLKENQRTSLGAIPLVVVGLWFGWRKQGLCASRANQPRTDKPSTMNMDTHPPESVATTLAAADPVPRFRIYLVLRPGSANIISEIKSESV